jgi:ubiquinone/menaquinone biosynthesis C-methylase UbiE
VFGGACSWSKPVRILDAGGGTGDATIFLAQQLEQKDINAEIVYIDLSQSSREIAEERARVRNLTNITFRTGSFLDLSANTDGTFDFINCSGVIHHLENPEGGLRTLVNLLRPMGGINLMVYGKLGRTGVYPVQDMLRLLIHKTESASDRVNTAKRLLAELPDTNWLCKSPHIMDHRGDDAGIYDLLLHSTDRSYSIPELAELLSSTGLRISAFANPILYDPMFWLKNEELTSKVELLEPLEKAAFTEQLIGFVKTHVVFAVREDNPVVLPSITPDSIPIWVAEFNDLVQSDTVHIDFSLQDTPLRFQFNSKETKILRLIDGKNSVSQILELSDFSQTDFKLAFTKVWTYLHGAGVLIMKY